MSKNFKKIILCILLLLTVVLTINHFRHNSHNQQQKNEIIRSKSYKKFASGDDSVEGTDNVKFSAFFLRDLNNDGISEKLYGTVKQLGETDRLYFEINVLSDGELKDAKVEINGKNFYLQTSLLKDSIIKNNTIGTNIKKIEFADISSGVQKLFSGTIRSGDYTSSVTKNSAIGSNNTNYSRDDNKIIFTGTYYPYEGEPIDVYKEIDITVDWYGYINTRINNTNQVYNSYSKNFDTTLSDDETVNYSFVVNTEETRKELLLKQNNVEVTIPDLNGYNPVEVTVNSSNVDYSFDSSTNILTIQRNSTEENGVSTTTVSSNNSYDITVKYPKQAYTDYYDDDKTSITLKFPVKEYYLGYNNPNSPYVNPLMSNVANGTISVTYKKYIPSTPQNPVIREDNSSMYIGTYISSPYSRYAISKYKPLKLYLGYSSEENDDDYIVSWNYYKGDKDTTNTITFKETKDNQEFISDQFQKNDNTYINAEKYVSFKGIYFNDLSSVMNSDGEIKVYDDETNELLLYISSDMLKKYNGKNNAFYYNNEIKHVRVEAIGIKKDSNLNVYNIKSIDDSLIINDFTIEEFEQLSKVKSTVQIYVNGEYLREMNNTAVYEVPYSLADISIDQKIYSTQENSNVNIKIITESNLEQNKLGWINGNFLIKLPDEFSEFDIKNIEINNNNVEIISYEFIDNEEGKFVKILTSNEEPEGYTIDINADVSPNRKSLAGTKTVALYASNDRGLSYFYKKEDSLDVNNNLDINEFVNYKSLDITVITPNLLLTTETITDFDDSVDNEVVVGPQVADIDKDTNEATVNVEIQNNYDTSISYISILGKIPFVGNKYILTGRDMNSQFDTRITTPLSIPEEIKDNVTIYYSTEENPTTDINDANNNWVLAQDIDSYENIKSFYISLGNLKMNNGDSYTFSYSINLPSSARYNEQTYSTHAVYFAIDTVDGKYQTKTEPTKVGIRMVKKYNLNLYKYQKNKEKLIPGATYSVTELDDNSEEILSTRKTATTDENGNLIIKDLLVEKTYNVKEIKTPNNYLLNDNNIKLYGSVDSNGEVVVDKISGDIRGNLELTKISSTRTNVKMNVEDEVLGNIKIVKKGDDTNLPLKGVRYKLTGPNYENGRILITDKNGIASLNNIKIGEEYTLEELKADEYYIAEPVIFKINNNDGIYVSNIISGDVNSSNIIENDSIPTIELNIFDEKIPTYTLNLTKIKNTKNVSIVENPDDTNGIDNNVTYLEGAVFYLYKNGKKIGEYTTNSNGTISIPNLYVYNQDKDVDATYVLKEVVTPSGYSKVKDIVFKVENQNSNLVFVESLSEGQAPKTYSSVGDTVNIIVEDMPSFKLTKKDSETNELLSHVKFVIYNIDDGERFATNSKNEIIGTKVTINNKDYYVVETDENGEIIIDLPEGLYKLVEVEADDKYDLTNKIYYFGIGTSRESENAGYLKYLSSTNGKYYGSNVYISKRGEQDYIVGANSYAFLYDGSQNLNEIKNIQGSVTGVESTSDGGFVIAGTASGWYVSDIVIDNFRIPMSRGIYTKGYIVKFDANNNVEFTSNVHTSGLINSLTAIPNGGYYVAGNGYLAKFDANNNEVFYKRFTGNPTISSLKMYPDGSYVIGGYFNSSSITIGDKVLTNTSSNYDSFVALFDSNDNFVDAISFGGSENDYINKIDIADDGDIVVSGNYNSNDLSLFGEEHPLLSDNSTNSYVAKINIEGDYDFFTNLPTSGTTKVSTIDNNGYIASVGNEIYKISKDGELEWSKNNVLSSISYIEYDNINDEYLIGGGAYGIYVGDYFIPNTSGGNNMQPVIAKFKHLEKPNINVSMDYQIYRGNSYGSDSINSIVGSYDGGYYVFGSLYGNLDLEGYSLNSGIFYAKYDENNQLEYMKNYSGTIVPYNDKNGFINFINYCSSTISVGDYNFKNVKYTSSYQGYNDFVIAKYNENNEVEHAVSFGGNGSDSISELKHTSDGGFVIIGSFTSDTLQLGDYTLNKLGNTTRFFAKFNSNMDVEYAKAILASNLKVSVSNDSEYVVYGTYEDNFVIDEHDFRNVGNSDIFVIKYDKSNKIVFSKSFGGDSRETIIGGDMTKDGGFAIYGTSSSTSIDLNEKVLSINGGFTIKFDKNGNIVISNSFPGYSGSIISTNDGGFVTISTSNGRFYIDDTYINIKSSSLLLIKYNSNNELENYSILGGGDYLLGSGSLLKAKDDGFILLASASSRFNVGQYEFVLTNGSNGSASGRTTSPIIAKYDGNFNVEWATVIEGYKTEYLTSVYDKGNKEFIVSGWFDSNEITLENASLTKKGSYRDYFLARYNVLQGAREQSELTALNNRKELKIVTSVNEIDNIKGGSISGDNLDIYETVLYGDDSQKDIVITPNPDYEIIGITVNGEVYDFIPNEDGSYVMPKFNNVTENKYIDVTFAYKSNKITINKTDSYTHENIKQSNVSFKLDQIEERDIPYESIKPITGNSDVYKEADTTKEVTGVVGPLQKNGNVTVSSVNTENEILGIVGNLNNNGDYYFVEKDGTYIPTNGKTYQLANGGTSGKGNTTANSYVEIDLTDKVGYYSVIVNASISSQSSYDYGYAFISDSTVAPNYSSNYQRIMYISGVQESTDYTSVGLQGGKKYYLHFGYYKNASSDIGDDQIVINSVKVYEATGVAYNFETDSNGSFVSNNIGVASSSAYSYVKIDLTEKTGTYKVIVNAEVSSEINDYGYVSVSTTPERASGNRFIYVSNNTSARDYYSYTTLEGGNVYYLHFAYTKNANSNSGDDQFKVNSVKVYETKDVRYDFVDNNGVYISSNQFKGNTTSRSYVELDLTDKTGTYILTVNAELSSQSGDYGYVTLTETPDKVEYNFSNNRIIYITGTQSAKDYTKVIEAGKKYYLHIGYYKTIDGDGGTDTFKVNSISLTPNEKDLYHTSVKTNNDGEAITQIHFGKYEVTEIDGPDGYYKESVPKIIEFRSTEGSPKEFDFDNDKIVKVVVHHYLKNEDGEYTTEKLADDEILENRIGEKYVTSPNMDIKDYDLIRDENNSYILPSNYEGTYTYDTIDVNYYYEKGDVLLTTRHLIEGTENPVPLKDGTESSFDTSLGRNNQEYTTSPLDNELLSDEYELSVIPENASGKYGTEEIVVTYYYKKVERNIKVTLVDEETEEKLSNATFILKRTDDILDNTNVMPNNRYYFVQDGTTYKSNNKGVANSSANSYIKLDLTNATEDITLKINYSISSERYDYGYITVTDNETAPRQNITNGRIVYISGIYSNREVEKVLEKGSVYYIHFGYSKNGSGNSGDDNFTINSISLNSYENYITDENGEVIISNINSGNYDLYEVFSPAKYYKGENTSVEINRDSSDTQQITITNRKKHGNVVVHHYLEGTTTPIVDLDGNPVEDEIKDDRIDSSYATKPKEELLNKYSVVTEIPENVSGEYIEGTIEVTYNYNLRKYDYFVEYYYNNVIDDTLTEKLQAYYLDRIDEYQDKPLIYNFEKTSNFPLIIDEDNKVIKVYYILKYNISTEVKEHTEKYYDGTTANVKGGTISGDGESVYEEVEYMKDSSKDIVITPNDGYEISSVKINNINLNVESFVDENGVITLNKNNNYFKQVTEDKHIEVEFRKKAKVFVKYLEVGTNNELENTIELNGYQDEEYTTTRINIPNYREANVQIENGLATATINSNDKYDENAQHVYTSDDQVITYWYEEIPDSTIIEKHIEIDEDGNQSILYEKTYTQQVGTLVNTERKEFKDNITDRNLYSIDGPVCDTCISKDINSYSATVEENKIIEVKYYYQRSYFISTKNSTLVGGSISGENEQKYEEIVKNGSNTLSIEISPNYGYRIKDVKVNDEVINISQLLSNGKVIIPANYFNNIQEDKVIEVEFERIPSKLTVKYIDIDTNEEIYDKKEIFGYIGDSYNEERVNISNYVKAGDEPISSGIMNTEVNEIIFYYRKLFKISINVDEHYEVIRDVINIPGDNENEREVTVSGGSISIEDMQNYEYVENKADSTKEIKIIADDEYIISSIKINNEEIEITDNKNMTLNKFTNVTEDKNIIVRFEKITKKIIVKYIDIDTNNVINEIEKIANINDNYNITLLDINNYDYIESTNNIKGIVDDDIEIKYYYKRRKKEVKDIMEILNPTTNDKVIKYFVVFACSLVTIVIFTFKKKLLKSNK